MSTHHMQDYNGLIVTKQLIRAMAHIFYMKWKIYGMDAMFIFYYNWSENSYWVFGKRYVVEQSNVIGIFYCNNKI